jgi:hypothetical protein
MLYSPGVTNADIGMEEKPTSSRFALPRITTGYSGAPHTAYIVILAAPQAGHGH